MGHKPVRGCFKCRHFSGKPGRCRQSEVLKVYPEGLASPEAVLHFCGTEMGLFEVSKLGEFGAHNVGGA